jgi:hypothetical protein
LHQLLAEAIMRTLFQRTPRTGLATALLLAGVLGTITMGAAAVDNRATSNAREPFRREITLPAGTVLPLTLDSSVASDRSRIEDGVRAHLRRAVVVNGVRVIPAGSVVSGHVTSVRRPGRVQGRGYIAFRFNSLSAPDNSRTAIRTTRVSRTAPATKGEDALKIGLPAAGGAVIGALAGGKKGAAIGATAGGGAGTAVVLSTRGRDVGLGAGAPVSVQLLEPIRLVVTTPAR